MELFSFNFASFVLLSANLPTVFGYCTELFFL